MTENVFEIRASDLPIKKIAEKFGLSSGAVQHIRSRRSWKHVIRWPRRPFLSERKRTWLLLIGPAICDTNAVTGCV